MIEIDSSKLCLLSNDEQRKLFLEKSERARQLLILGNVKLVLSLLKRYQNRDNIDDLFSVGMIGLIKAIDNFDLGFNVCFSTYAVPMILGEIKRYIRDNTSLRISRSIKDNCYKIMMFEEDYVNKNGTNPSKKCIMDSLDLSEYDYYLAVSSKRDLLSIDEMVYDGVYLEEEIGDESDFTDNIILKDAINKLDDKERNIIKKRYFYGKTQLELSREFNISQAQISRDERSALNHIKEYMIKK